MGLPYYPKDFRQLEDFLIDLITKLDNLEGKIGKGLSHNDLADIEDHAQFIRADGSVQMEGPLKMGGNNIQNAGNDIIRANVRQGDVKVNKDTNQLEYDSSTISTNISTVQSNTDSVALSGSTCCSTNYSRVLSNSLNISSNESRLTAGGH